MEKEEIDFNNKKVILRVDYNVPITNNKITDNFKILSSLKTINYLLDKNAKIILMSHLGKINNETDKQNNSLRLVALELSKIIGFGVKFCPFTRGRELEDMIDSLLPKEILLMENTRFEDVPNNYESGCDMELSKYWASLGDIFVLDAFASAHRKHASTFGIPSFIPSTLGFLVNSEIEVMDKIKVINKSLLLGGSKVSDKIKLISSLSKNSDYICLGGMMCFTFLKASKEETYDNFVDESFLSTAKKLLEDNKNKIILPIDVVTNNGIKDVYKINKSDIIFDIGPKTISLFEDKLLNSSCVICNGTMGKFEDSKYKNGTTELFKFLNNNSIKTIVCGGDTSNAVHELEIDFDYVSTGGGATLEYLEKGSLEVIDHIKKANK